MFPTGYSGMIPTRYCGMFPNRYSGMFPTRYSGMFLNRYSGMFGISRLALMGSAAKRGGNNLKWFMDFHLKPRTIFWSFLSCMC